MRVLENTTTGDSSSEFERAMEAARPKIIAVGCGGAGCNTITRLGEAKTGGIETIAVNTDAQDLLHAKADKKILIGREVTGGLGTGSDPSKGKKAAEADEDLFKDPTYEADMVFITCGLGGGTGTGAGPIVGEVSKRMGALTVGVLTLPFEAEGRKRARNAKLGLENFRETLDSIILIPDDRLLEVAPDLSIVEAFKLADRILSDLIEGITELMTKPGLINLDFADIESILDDGGMTMVGIGESSSEDRAVEATEKALDSPLLEVKMENVDKALVNIVGSPDMSLEEAERIAGMISGEFSRGAHITWGAQIDENMEAGMKVMIIVPGVEFHWQSVQEKRKRDEVEESLKDLRRIS